MHEQQSIKIISLHFTVHQIHLVSLNNINKQYCTCTNTGTCSKVYVSYYRKVTGTIPPDSHKEFKTEEKGPFFKSNKDTISDYNIDKVHKIILPITNKLLLLHIISIIGRRLVSTDELVRICNQVCKGNDQWTTAT